MQDSSDTSDASSSSSSSSSVSTHYIVGTRLAGISLEPPATLPAPRQPRKSPKPVMKEGIRGPKQRTPTMDPLVKPRKSRPAFAKHPLVGRPVPDFNKRKAFQTKRNEQLTLAQLRRMVDDEIDITRFQESALARLAASDGAPRSEALGERITKVYLDLVFPTFQLHYLGLDATLAGAYRDPGMRWEIFVSPFYRKDMADDELMALCVAVWASRHHAAGFGGGYELQVVGHAGGLEGRSSNERGRGWAVICNQAEKLLPSDQPGADFASSRWWQVFKFCTTRLGISLIDSRGPRYQTLKIEIARDLGRYTPEPM